MTFCTACVVGLVGMSTKFPFDSAVPAVARDPSWATSFSAPAAFAANSKMNVSYPNTVNPAKTQFEEPSDRAALN
jgi:hypothetical protein